jgi:hypothetical protein
MAKNGMEPTHLGYHGEEKFVLGEEAYSQPAGACVTASMS